MENTQERTVLLLRASSKQQTDREHDFDIPQQKLILVPFIEQKGWNLIRTFTEGGISGYKVSANDRDAIQDIKRMADNHEFDRLVIYMSDRLGRIADETPLIVSYLNKRGIEIYSYTEGVISSIDHTDKLITYIRYWQAEGESIKTSKRVSDNIERMVKDGIYRGGAPAYGYKMVNNGRNNYKGKPVLDIVIDEDAAAVVRKIFELAREHNYGYRQIAKYLNDNGYRTKKGNLWSTNTVGQVLHHSLYRGDYELKEKKGCRNDARVTSPPMEDLIIIPRDEWYETHKALEKRSKHKKGTRHTNHGIMLLAGLLYCGYCGKKFTSFQSKSKKTEVNGEVVKTFVPKYRCTSYRFPQEDMCEGQSTYSAKKVEETVIKALKKYISSLNAQDLVVSYLEKVGEQIKAARKELGKIVAGQTRAIKELSALKDEVVKSLIGESKFDSTMLQDLLSKKEKEVQESRLAVENKERIVEGLEDSRKRVYNLNSRMSSWSTDFDEQSVEGRKAMLYQVIDRINVFKDRVEIHVNIKMDMYENGLEERAADLVVAPIVVPITPDDLPESISALQSNLGDVQSASLAGSGG